MINYGCPRCGYETEHKTNIVNHLYKKKKACPQIKNEIELTDEIKEHILNNRIYKIDKTPTKTEKVLVEQMKKMKVDICMIKFHKNEDFYQHIVEKYLNGTHMKLPSGITDVTNEKIHAEIKKWDQFKKGIFSFILRPVR